jgi:hypothetical protein
MLMTRVCCSSATNMPHHRATHKQASILLVELDTVEIADVY